MRPLPAYQQIKDDIIRQIDAGVWCPGDKVPSEHALMRAHGVSRMTVNRALREMAQEGLLVRVQGTGTFVAERKQKAALLEIKPIAEEIAERGRWHNADIVCLEAEKPDAEIRRLMNLGDGREIYHAVVVHYEDGIPIQIEDRHVDPAMAPAFLAQDFSQLTPSQYLLDSVPVSEVEHVVEARLPSTREQSLLNTAADDPCLVLRRRTWARGRVVTLVELVHAGSRYRLGGRFAPTPSDTTAII